MGYKERVDADGRRARGTGERLRRDGPRARRVLRRALGARGDGGGLRAPGDGRGHRQPPPEILYGEPRFGLRALRGRARLSPPRSSPRANRQKEYFPFTNVT